MKKPKDNGARTLDTRHPTLGTLEVIIHERRSTYRV
jgi:hypothetical protein